MTNTAELLSLIHQARALGADAFITWDSEAKRTEGRDIIVRVTVTGAKGIGPYPMAPIAAAERLREFVARAHVLRCQHGVSVTQRCGECR